MAKSKNESKNAKNEDKGVEIPDISPGQEVKEQTEECTVDLDNRIRNLLNAIKDLRLNMTITEKGH